MSDDAPARVVELGRRLRNEGVATGTGGLLVFARAASIVGPEDLYWVGRATLVSRHDDFPAYDRAFAAAFGRPPAPEPPDARRPQAELRAAGALPATEGRARTADPDDASAASSIEVLRRKSFAECSPEDLARMARLMAQLRLRAPERRSRRRRPARAGEPDLRRTLRRAMRSGGEPIRRAWRSRRRVRRRLLFVLDVSGSMAAYSHGLLLFAHAALRADRRWEAFAFGTRLTRLTSALVRADPDEALSAAARAAGDWDGGTRIGAALEELLASQQRGNVVRGAVVVLLSDGLDVGDPELLADRMADLGRLAHSVVWLNPLMENPDYAPLARGMRAALPHIDHFAPGHDLASLEDVADVIARL